MSTDPAVGRSPEEHRSALHGPGTTLGKADTTTELPVAPISRPAGATGKRLIDIVLAAIGLVVLAPVLAVLTVAVWRSVGRPILFTQRRVGLNGREFDLKKFRSMLDLNGPDGQPRPDVERTTRIGWIIRRTRLDELPELWQVIKGDMSIVGPRPLPRAVVAGKPLGKIRSLVRPGLTGLAQTSGNTLLSDEEKFALDAYYVKNRTLSGDLAILLRTVLVVLFDEKRDEPLIKRALIDAFGSDRCR